MFFKKQRVFRNIQRETLTRACNFRCDFFHQGALRDCLALELKTCVYRAATFLLQARVSYRESHKSFLTRTYIKREAMRSFKLQKRRR